MKIKTIKELKSRLQKMAGKLIDEMDNVSADNIALAQGYLVQSRICLKIASTPNLLKKVYKQINDENYNLADIGSITENKST